MRLIILAQEWLYLSLLTVINRHLNSTGIQPTFFCLSTFSEKNVYVPWESRELTNTAISRRGNAIASNAERHFHYKDGRFQMDQATRTSLEYVWWDIRKRVCLTSNSKYSSNRSFQHLILPEDFLYAFFSIWQILSNKFCFNIKLFKIYDA